MKEKNQAINLSLGQNIWDYDDNSRNTFGSSVNSSNFYLLVLPNKVLPKKQFLEMF
jgi:hypothetical protein